LPVACCQEGCLKLLLAILSLEIGGFYFRQVGSWDYFAIFLEFFAIEGFWEDIAFLH